MLLLIRILMIVLCFIVFYETSYLFASSHKLTFSNSVFQILDIFTKCVPSMKTDVSSANNIENSRSYDLEKSFV